jgi:hypothetical protein
MITHSNIKLTNIQQSMLRNCLLRRLTKLKVYFNDVKKETDPSLSVTNFVSSILAKEVMLLQTYSKSSDDMGLSNKSVNVIEYELWCMLREPQLVVFNKLGIINNVRDKIKVDAEQFKQLSDEIMQCANQALQRLLYGDLKDNWNEPSYSPVTLTNN